MASPTDASFRYVGGNPALDLVNTVDWTDHGLVHERLSDYTQLIRWAEGAGVIDAAAARQLRKRASRRRARAARTGHPQVFRRRQDLIRHSTDDWLQLLCGGFRGSLQTRGCDAEVSAKAVNKMTEVVESDRVARVGDRHSGAQEIART